MLIIDDILTSYITQTDTATYTVRSGTNQYIVRMTIPVPSCESVDSDQHCLPRKLPLFNIMAGTRFCWSFRIGLFKY